MSTTFHNILVPVDFSINTEVAVKKAIELADPHYSRISLLHVWNMVVPSPDRHQAKGGGKDPAKLQEKLVQWSRRINDALPGMNVPCLFESGASIQTTICNKALDLHTDLIVIGQHSSHYWLPFLNTVVPSEVATQAGCAVLTVKPGALHNRIRTLVVPVTDHLPQIKMEAISALCKKNKLKVHLVTFMDDENQPLDFSASSLLQVYQWLRTTLHCPAEYTVLHGSNRAKAILAYSEKVNADILLLHPETETKTGWLNRHISDLLSPASGVQVLTVQPAN
jgi:nucleotide-binding universal stress UspA family protein